MPPGRSGLGLKPRSLPHGSSGNCNADEKILGVEPTTLADGADRELVPQVEEGAGESLRGAERQPAMLGMRRGTRRQA